MAYCVSCSNACPEPAYCGLLRLIALHASIVRVPSTGLLRLIAAYCARCSHVPDTAYCGFLRIIAPHAAIPRVPSTGILRLIVAAYCKSCCPACLEQAYCGLLRLTARDATKALNQIPPSPTRSSSSACCTRCLGRRLPAVEAGPAVPRQPKQAGEGQAGRLPPRPSRLACPPRRLPVCRYTCRSACLPACLPVSVQAADGAAETSRRLAARCLNRVRARVHAVAGSRARIIVAARSLNRVIACAPACGVWARSR